MLKDQPFRKTVWTQTPTDNRHYSNTLTNPEKLGRTKLLLLKNFSWKRLCKFAGPGLLVSIANIDPGNLGIDIQAGARFSYSLLWAVLFSTLLGLLFQFLSLKLGIASGKSFGKINSERKNKNMRIFLWVVAEITIICGDVPQVLGSAFALRLIFSVPLSVGVVSSVLSVFIVQLGEFLGFRKIERLIGCLVGITAFCIIVQFFTGSVSFTKVVGGFLPRFPSGSGGLVMAFIGSVITPYNFYFHSSLVTKQNISKTKEEQNEAIFYNFIELSIASFICFVINLSLVSISAADFNEKGKLNVTLKNAPELMTGLLGGLAPYLLAIALFASSQSSIITSSLAGQCIMEDLIYLKLSPLIRAFITRCFAVLPSLGAVLLISESGSDNLIIVSQAIVSLLLPFPLILLLKYTSEEHLMQTQVNKKTTNIIASVCGVLITAANVWAVWVFILETNEKYRNYNFVLLCVFTVFYIFSIYFVVSFQKEDNKGYKRGEISRIDTFINKEDEKTFLSELEFDELNLIK